MCEYCDEFCSVDAQLDEWGRDYADDKGEFIETDFVKGEEE